jgi:hypothetical protein
MTRKTTKSQTAVERLLEQQQQYQEWHDRLDSEAKQGAPSHVATRVRADYAARLEEVNTELREHEDAVRQALGDAKSRAEGLEKQHAERTDELAEARLRRQVGEYDEEKYDEVANRCKAAIAELTKAIQALERDIERYEEILEQIQGGAEEEEAAAEPAQPEQPEPAAAARGDGTAKTPRPGTDLDELEFLRSLGGQSDYAKAGQARRISQPAMQSPVGAVPPPPQAPPPEAPEPAVDETPGGQPGQGRQGEPGEARTLVCTECGTKNLPTEWYCEKCGAELSTF